MRSVRVLFFLGACFETAWPQSYPGCLEQGSLGWGLTAVGYSNPGFYKDSSASRAWCNARQNLAGQRSTVITGGQAFWATEAGTAWMGSSLTLSVDSAALRIASRDTGSAEVDFQVPVELHNFGVVARWFDARNQTF